MFLTVYNVKPDDLQACHGSKRNDTMIVKFKSRKQKLNIIINRKRLHNKSNILTQLSSSGKLSVSERTINHLINVDTSKTLGRFIPRGFGITLSMSNLMNWSTYESFNVIDIEKLLGVVNLDKFKNNTSF